MSFFSTPYTKFSYDAGEPQRTPNEFALMQAQHGNLGQQKNSARTNSPIFSPPPRVMEREHIGDDHNGGLTRFRAQCSDLLSILEDTTADKGTLGRDKTLRDSGGNESGSPFQAILKEIDLLCSFDRTPNALTTVSPRGVNGVERGEARNNMVASPTLRSAVCLAPVATGTLDTVAANANHLGNQADWITSYALRWFFFTLETQRKNTLGAATVFGKVGPHFLPLESAAKQSAAEIKSVLDSIEYLVCQLNEATPAEVHQQKQLCLHISNRLAETMDVGEKFAAMLSNQIAALSTNSREDILRAELEASAGLIARLHEENNDLKKQNGILEHNASDCRDMASKALAEKEDLVSYFERVAADNAELIARLHEVDLAEGKQDSPAQEKSSNSNDSAAHEELARLQSQLGRQTQHVRELQDCLEDADAESSALRDTINQLRQSLRRHRTVIDMLTSADARARTTSRERIEEILSGSRDDEIL